MKKNTWGFSIILWMWLMMLLCVSAYVLLSYIIPFSKNVKGIENSSNAYYTSYAGIEQALYFVKNRAAINTDTGKTLPTTATGYSFVTSSSGQTIPTPNEGTSEFDTNYNAISMTNPIQLEVGKWYLSTAWTAVNFYFRVPDLDGDSATDDETLTWGTLPIINWMLTSQDDTLYASGTYIDADHIKKSFSSDGSAWNIHNKNGYTLSGSALTFSTYYGTYCGASSGCTLKISVVNDLFIKDGTATGKQIPYLEYKIEWLSSNFPNRYTNVQSVGKSYGFQKSLEVKVPQQTVNQALDFTVFQ